MTRSFSLIAVLAFLPVAAWGQAPAPAPGGEPDLPVTATLSSGRTMEFLPIGEVFPISIADPHQAGNAVLMQGFTRVGIPDSGGPRAFLKVGGRFGIVRIGPPTAGGRSWQVSFDAGIDTQFDSENSLDNIGWDGNYGFTLTTATDGPLSFKLALLHCSAHVGDEYAERTGRKRIEYTRGEVVTGLARRLWRTSRVYAETGYGTGLKAEEQRPWRFQGGFEWKGSPSVFGRRFAPYVATDLQLWEERDWRLDKALQLGITTTARGRRVRLGLQFDDGRPPLGEFFQYTELWVSFGIWMDL